MDMPEGLATLGASALGSFMAWIAHRKVAMRDLARLIHRHESEYHGPDRRRKERRK